VRGSSIFVPAGRRDALRLTLAGQGLPANSVRGYELLDSLSGFGTTAQMFDAA
jgi:flagellar M-ring protein FliF